MKITTKMSKNDLKEYLNRCIEEVKRINKSLYDQIQYTVKALKKDETSVTKADLLGLARQVQTTTGIDPEPVLEASVKKSAKKTTQKESSKKEPLAEDQEEKKPIKKLNKKAVTQKESSHKNEVPLAEMFSEEIEIEGTTFKVAHDIKNMEDLVKAFDDGDEDAPQILLAFYWTPRHLAQFPYQNGMLKVPKEFKDDLDLCYIHYVSDQRNVAYAISIEHEGFYPLYPENIKELDEGLRVCNGIEYQIYREV